MTGYHEDSDVPQQCARASHYYFSAKEIRKINLLLGSRMIFSKDYEMKIIYFAQ